MPGSRGRACGLARRAVLAGGLCASFIRAPQFARAANGEARRAILGHRFRDGEALFEVVDLVSPHPNALMPRARSFARDARGLMADCLREVSGAPVEPVGEPNRWGVQPVMVPVRGTTEKCLAEKLVAKGAARVLPTSNNPVRIAALLAAEEQARLAGAGLWGLNFYRVRNANLVDDCRDAIGSIQVLTGTVMEARLSRRRAFINFGTDYREDVTATIPAREARKWFNAGRTIESLSGKTIRVRGYLEWINGPSLSLTHPQALEVLGETNAAAD